jgi:hypothetical protein
MHIYISFPITTKNNLSHDWNTPSTTEAAGAALEADKPGAAVEADKPGATKALVSITEFNWLVMRLY